MAIESQEEFLVLVDENNQELGTMEKMQVHQKGLLHRAFSIFIFNDRNELLLQKRDLGKYHSGGLWTNTCCGHPRPEEETKKAAKRRLFEEMGFTVELQLAFNFTYQATFENNLIENEYDLVFFGFYSKNPNPTPEEVSEWKYISWNELINDVKLNPHSYTYWFKICLEKIIENETILPFKI